MLLDARCMTVSQLDMRFGFLHFVVPRAPTIFSS